MITIPPAIVSKYVQQQFTIAMPAPLIDQYLPQTPFYLSPIGGYAPSAIKVFWDEMGTLHSVTLSTKAGTLEDYTFDVLK